MAFNWKIRSDIEHKWPAWFAGILALLGAVVFLIQAFWYAHTSISSLDEGAYLYKGVLFATGQYRPFQLYGVWTNKAPLAFLIPGYFELLFGPGLRTGRYLSIFMSFIGLIGVWIASLRLGRSRWLAAAAVWAFALDPVQIKIYSQGITQGIVASMLTWMLVLALNEKRLLWQLILSGFLAGLIVLTRQNMILVMPLLIVYILWQDGWKAALYSLLAGAGIFLFFHILYWPYIMQLWIPWLPQGTRTIFANLTVDHGGQDVWNPAVPWDGRLLSFFYGFRYYFVALAGSAMTFILWPKSRDWKAQDDFRAAVFLGVLFVSLLSMHLWASIYLDYCVFCFPNYLAFFYVVAILLLVTVLKVLQRNIGFLRQILLILTILVLFTGIGFSVFEDAGNQLLSLAVPRVSGGKLLPGFTTLWDALSNKFSMERNAAEKIVSSAAGLAVGLALLILVFLIFKRLKHTGINYAYLLAVVVLALGLVFSPLLAGSAAQPDCSIDVIAANERVGAYLAQNIPQGSKVYWNGGLSIAPLLYVPGIKIYPAQINNGYSFRVGGDPLQLVKYGFWNASLAGQWLNDADFVVVESRLYPKRQDVLTPDRFDKLPASPVPTSCLNGSRLLIFQRK